MEEEVLGPQPGFLFLYAPVEVRHGREGHNFYSLDP